VARDDAGPQEIAVEVETAGSGRYSSTHVFVFDASIPSLAPVPANERRKGLGVFSVFALIVPRSPVLGSSTAAPAAPSAGSAPAKVAPPAWTTISYLMERPWKAVPSMILQLGGSISFAPAKEGEKAKRLGYDTRHMLAEITPKPDQSRSRSARPCMT
jgi:hypothetical protein